MPDRFSNAKAENVSKNRVHTSQRPYTMTEDGEATGLKAGSQPSGIFSLLSSRRGALLCSLPGACDMLGASIGSRSPLRKWFTVKPGVLSPPFQTAAGAALIY
jgi:hypothetical protein